MPIGDGYLFLVPALQAIVDRLEALEAAARLRELERRLERLEQSAHGHDFSARVATPLDPVMEAQRRATDAAGRDEPI
jgi:hypothetical protein